MAKIIKTSSGKVLTSSTGKIVTKNWASLTITFARGTEPIGCYIKVNGEASTISYDFILPNQIGAQIVIPHLHKNDYITCYAYTNNISLTNPINCTVSHEPPVWKATMTSDYDNATVEYECNN